MAWKSDRVWVTGDVFPWTGSQVKRAGDRIRRASAQGLPPTDADLELLDVFRSSHYPALRHTQDRLVRLFHKKYRLDPQVVPITARPLKTREAIIAKLVRDRARLNRIHDIAGARIIVPDRATQERALAAIFDALGGLGPEVVKDTRTDPDEHGYRALHVVVSITAPGVGARPAEIQLRTEAEDVWAQIVERTDAILGSDLKHGHGPADHRTWLLKMSAWVRDVEEGRRSTMPKMPTVPDTAAETTP